MPQRLQASRIEVEGEASEPVDEFLVQLGPGPCAKLFVLTAPTPGTTQRLLRFARTLIENPSLARFEAAS